jgi:hypothetical protein
MRSNPEIQEGALGVFTSKLNFGALPKPCIRVALPLLRNADIGQREYRAPACQLGYAPKLIAGGRGTPADRYLRLSAAGGLTEYPAHPTHQ